MAALKRQLVPLLSVLALGAALNVALAEDSAVDRATDATKRAAKNTNAWIKRAAHKTDAALDRAADKVGLKGDGRKSKNDAADGKKAGPRP